MKQKTRAADIIPVRERYIQAMGFDVLRSDESGLRRIALSDGTHVEVWLTTGTWTAQGTTRLNDWTGFVRWMAVMG